MRTEKIKELKRSWGDKPCIHPLLKNAEVTNDKVCTTCGRTVYSGYNKVKKLYGDKNS